MLRFRSNYFTRIIKSVSSRMPSLFPEYKNRDVAVDTRLHCCAAGNNYIGIIHKILLTLTLQARDVTENPLSLPACTRRPKFSISFYHWWSFMTYVPRNEGSFHRLKGFCVLSLSSSSALLSCWFSISGNVNYKVGEQTTPFLSLGPNSYTMT